MIQLAITAGLNAADPSDIDGVMATRNAAGMVAVTVSDEDYTGAKLLLSPATGTVPR